MTWVQGGQRRLLINCLAAVAVAWLPLLVLTLLDGQAAGGASLRPLLIDLSSNARILLSLPLFIAASSFIGPRLRSVTDYISNSGLLTGPDRDRFESDTAAYGGWNDARPAKVCIGILAVVASLLTLIAQVNGGEYWFSDGSGRYAGISPAGWWHVSVSLTLWHYVALRRIWQFVTWSIFLARLSRLDLQLVPTHPDRCGGLGILEMGQLSFSVLGTGFSIILSASLAESLVAGSILLPAVVPPIAIFVLICILVILLPLLGFMGMLIRAKRLGLVAYGDLGEELFRAFGAKWAALSNEKQREMLGNVDPSSLADYGYTFEVVTAMRTFVLSRNGMKAVAAATLSPFIPLAFINNSFTEVLERLLGIGR